MTDAPVPTALQARAILAAAPQITPSASLPGASQTGVPQQRVLAAAIGALIAYFVVKYSGIDIPAELIAGVVAGLLAMFVPASQRDAINDMTDARVHAAMRDPSTMVSYVQTPVTPAPGEPPVIVPPATKTP